MILEKFGNRFLFLELEEYYNNPFINKGLLGLNSNVSLGDLMVIVSY